MHEIHFEARLDRVREKLKQRFPHLSDPDLFYEKGNTNGFCEKLGRKLLIDREEAGALVYEIINEVINESILPFARY